MTKIPLPYDKPYEEQTLIERLWNRAAVRRGIGRGNGERDRIADLLEDAALYIKEQELLIHSYQQENKELRRMIGKDQA
jgi:hypothetical protein